MKHKVFISYHHGNDQHYKNLLENLFTQSNEIFISKSVQIGDIDPNLKTDTIRQKIRDEYLKDSTVTIVLIGIETWKRKHVDWEISSSNRDTKNNPRSGLLGIFLPTYPLNSNNQFNQYTIPPRLYYNWSCKYAKLKNWNTNAVTIKSWIEEAFQNRTVVEPNNSYPSYVNNRTGDRWYE